MARVEIGNYLAVDTRVCGGRLIFKGSRIMVADALELSEMGYPPEEIARQYHDIITPDAVREALSLVRRGTVREVPMRITQARVGTTDKSDNGKRARASRAAELKKRSVRTSEKSANVKRARASQALVGVKRARLKSKQAV